MKRKLFSAAVIAAIVGGIFLLFNTVLAHKYPPAPAPDANKTTPATVATTVARDNNAPIATVNGSGSITINTTPSDSSMEGNKVYDLKAEKVIDGQGQWAIAGSVKVRYPAPHDGENYVTVCFSDKTYGSCHTTMTQVPYHGDQAYPFQISEANLYPTPPDPVIVRACLGDQQRLIYYYDKFTDDQRRQVEEPKCVIANIRTK